MKQTNLIFMFAILMSMVGNKSFAHSIEVKNADGVTIYYNYTNNGTELEVTYRGSNSDTYSNEYTGNIVIPSEVTYSNKTYKVTSIRSYAFYGCSGLTSITIPNSVTSIGYHAFYGCSGLTSITIPNSVTSIGSEAFYACSGLTSITIPNSVTSIGDKAFYGCSKLTSVTLHCKTIGSWFSGLESIKEVILGNEVTSIGSYAFRSCSGLTSVTIPNSVTGIGSYAFQNCSGLTSITIPNSVTSIGWSAFSGCSGLTSVTISNSVTSIEKYAFDNCSSLTSVTIGAGVLSIGTDAFRNANPKKVIRLTNTPPSGYSYAEGTVNYVANDLYTSLSNKTVYSFLSSMFEVDGVKYVPVSPSERTCDAIDCNYDESAENVNIGNTVSYKGVNMTVKQVKPYVCYGNNYIKTVQLNLSGDIGSFAFYNCGIKELTIGANVTGISDYAFQNCAKMEKAILGDNITSIGTYAFSGCKMLKSISIPDATTSVGYDAFLNCSSMETVQMGSGLTAISIYTFSGCSSLTDVKIGVNVETINQYAFYSCSALPSITIPQSVTSIGNYVFSGCTSLKTVTLEDKADDAGLALGSNGSSPLFANCPLESVYIGRNISYSTSSSYGYSPFYRNTSLQSVVITDRETEISENEFYGCTNLKSVAIGDGVTTIGNRAFSGCSSLESFAFGTSVQTIGQEAFSDCTAMTHLISKAMTPPACGTQALDDINKWTCILSVPTGCNTAYQQADQWKEFFFIDNDVTGISAISNDKDVTIKSRYTLDGKLLSHPQKDINIIKMSESKKKKVFVK